jgi:signal transduction histidine kinase
MALSLSSRFVVVASAALVFVAGLNYWASCRVAEQQRASQASALLERFSRLGEPDFARLDQDAQIVASGSHLRVFDNQGLQLYGDREALPGATLAWAHRCATTSRNPCFQGRMAAEGLGPGHSPTGFLVLSLPRASLTRLLPWTLGATLVAVIFLAFAFERIAEVVYRQPLRDLRESTRSLDAGVPRKLTYATPEIKSSRPAGPLRTLLLHDEEIGDFAMELELMRGVAADAKEALVNRERLHLQWLAYLSHDLGAPLTRVLKRLETIEYTPELTPEERDRLLNGIHIEITQLAEIIGSVSQFAVLESNIERNFSQADITPILEYAVEVFECEADKKGIELDLRVEPGIGYVRIERSLIRRAIENLLANAIRHTPEGGLVSVGAERVGNTVCIRVTDTGTGIPAEELQKIFDFAFRGEGQTRLSQVGSLGLGLALVRKVAEVHNGSVTARNVTPQGAEFVISLPAVDSAPSGEEGSQHLG